MNRGRPPSPNPRLFRGRPSFTAEEMIQVAAHAALAGLSVAEFLRRAALAQMRREAKP